MTLIVRSVISTPFEDKILEDRFENFEGCGDCRKDNPPRKSYNNECCNYCGSAIKIYRPRAVSDSVELLVLRFDRTVAVYPAGTWRNWWEE